MATNTKGKRFHVDNLYLMKKLDDEYLAAFNRVYDYVEEDTKRSLADKNIILNIALEQCLAGMESKKKAIMVIPRDTKEFVVKYSKGPVFKEMKKKIRNQDYEKLQIASIWIVFMVCIVLFFFKNLLMEKYVINYVVNAVVACAAGAFAFSNYMIKRRIIKRYGFGSFYLRLDVITIVACVFVKIVSESNFDISYLLLVIAYFVTKKKIKPEFEAVIQ